MSQQVVCRVIFNVLPVFLMLEIGIGGTRLVIAAIHNLVGVVYNSWCHVASTTKYFMSSVVLEV